ncbi:MAG TPA: glycosyltransferase family 2 protein [Smithellaceae bacterium]|nr:glycosyltransferase family 2 protein [Syntrophales bacterium]HPL67816.1 glycosyltransferase family 2 protein [Smithellaceae bacterium]
MPKKVPQSAADRSFLYRGDRPEEMAPAGTVDLSIVIVNWNTRELLQNCLESVRNTVKDLIWEAIVVDNASTDGSVAMLQEYFSEVRVIVNEKNRGFGAANNQAFALMKGRYALLLNTDAILTDNAVAELFSFMESHPEAGMCCGQLLNRDGSKQNSIAAFPTLFTLLINMPLIEYLLPGKYPSKRYEYHRPIAVESCVGACMMIRRAAMDSVGWFDERYFFFFEETDWAYRMHRAGWQVFYVPAARVYHFQGQSIGPDIRSRIEFYRSRYQFFQKWHGPLYYALIRGVIFSRLFINWLFTALAAVLTLGIPRRLRSKLSVYTALVRWHFQSRSSPPLG